MPFYDLKVRETKDWHVQIDAPNLSAAIGILREMQQSGDPLHFRSEAIALIDYSGTPSTFVEACVLARDEMTEQEISAAKEAARVRGIMLHPLLLQRGNEPKKPLWQRILGR